jgi:hypothetical protein
MKTATTIFCALILCAGAALAQPRLQRAVKQCNERNSGLCRELAEPRNYDGRYSGHDEPEVNFYSNVPGSGSSMVYKLILPAEPPTQPIQNGGGVFNFELHPAFWVGMALCDSQSFPNFTNKCAASSDANIFENPNPNAKDYIGHHPGAAFLEVQFYPPGWVSGADATRYAAAIAIFSFSSSAVTGLDNNADCLNKVGVEPGNFAFIEKDGVPVGPPDPLNSNAATFTPDPNKTLFMNPGDTLLVTLRDTPEGLRVSIKDLTTGKSGFMVASAKNGFAQIVYNPSVGSSCEERPYGFRPMYSTSSEKTRTPWAAASGNVSFSDEIGHFEFCTAIDQEGGNCTVPGGKDVVLDADDTSCFGPASSPLIAVTGCTATETDFDGVSYQKAWPGTFTNQTQDALVHPKPVRFTSPRFFDSDGQLRNYDRAGLEADLPAIENASTPPCSRVTGANCVNPPKGAEFYPFYSTAQISDEQCVWQLGGAHIPGTTNTFGGNSTTAFGPLLAQLYPVPGGSVVRFNTFRRIFDHNPCQSDSQDVNQNNDQ